MTEETVHLALFKDIDPAAEAVVRLRELGIGDDDITFVSPEVTILSGVPYSEKMLGRPTPKTLIPKFAIAGFILGFIASLLFNLGTPLVYPIRVGGMPYLPIPTTLLLTFEISMLGLMVFTFLGLLWECGFPDFGPKEYHPAISDGQIAVVFRCPPEIHGKAHESLAALGAEWVHRTEPAKL